VKDQFDNAMVSQPTFVWSVCSGEDSISSAELFTAPATAGTSVVRVASIAFSGDATVTIIIPVAAVPTTLKLTPISRTQIKL